MHKALTFQYRPQCIQQPSLKSYGLNFNSVLWSQQRPLFYKMQKHVPNNRGWRSLFGFNRSKDSCLVLPGQRRGRIASSQYSFARSLERGSRNCIEASIKVSERQNVWSLSSGTINQNKTCAVLAARNTAWLFPLLGSVASSDGRDKV